MKTASSSKLVLCGVDHTARPTWKLKETVEFYRDILGLPLIHVISARGWGPATHPDFLHFFFDSGHGSTIAFFYYLGSDVPEQMQGRDNAAVQIIDSMNITHSDSLFLDKTSIFADFVKQKNAFLVFNVLNIALKDQNGDDMPR